MFVDERGLRNCAEGGTLEAVPAGFEQIDSAGFRNAAYGNITMTQALTLLMDMRAGRGRL
jgi:hypothetical protein